MGFLEMDFFFPRLLCSRFLSIWKTVTLFLGKFCFIIIMNIFTFLFLCHSFCKFTIIMQMLCFLNWSYKTCFIHHFLVFHLTILEISWGLVYNSVTKGPLISVMNFHGAWGKSKNGEPHTICLYINNCQSW